jgi:hypothetical protein
MNDATTRESVVCLDEKPITLHAVVRPTISGCAGDGKPGSKANTSVVWHGQCFLCVEPKAGRHFTFATPDHSGFQFAQVAAEMVLQYPETTTIHLVRSSPSLIPRGLARLKLWLVSHLLKFF